MRGRKADTAPSRWSDVPKEERMNFAMADEPTTHSAETELMEANAAFYLAFARGDLDAMADLWSHSEDVVCAHPGNIPLHGRGEVMESWEAILESPPPVVAHEPRTEIWGDIGAVLCIEQIGPALLAATNLFRHEGGVWRMIHHHSGQLAQELAEAAEDEGEGDEEDDLPPTVH